jgi:DNA (cytosine-5)-methyltransferase 1
MKVLNLYAGIGGNRKLWEGVDVTAVEYDEKIAAVYADLFPDDQLIVGDAHEYLEDNFRKYDFIWSSPPCQSHSSFRHNLRVRYGQSKPIYPDMRLYEEILFLQHYAPGVWIVENVVPYYGALIPAQKVGRHLYWTNLELSELPKPDDNIRNNTKISDLEKLHGYDLSSYPLPNKRQVLRNVVSPTVGLSILDEAKKVFPGG